LSASTVARIAPVFRWLLACLALSLAMSHAAAWAQVAVPPLQSRVTDLTGSLDEATRASLENRLRELEQAKGSQIAVLLVPTTQPESIEQFGLGVAETWKLGRKGVDDGVLLLVAKDDRALRIEVGYGLEGAIPDAVAQRVIEESIVPRFREGDFSGGVEAGAQALIRLVEGEALPPAPGADAGVSGDDALSLAMMFIFVVGGILRALFGALIGAAVAGGSGLPRRLVAARQSGRRRGRRSAGIRADPDRHFQHHRRRRWSWWRAFGWIRRGRRRFRRRRRLRALVE